MATQGMIVIYTRIKGEEKILYKIVCGSDGFIENLKLVSCKIQASLIYGWPSEEDLYDISKEKLGCEDCLVVVGKDKIAYKGDEEISPLYRKTFNRFNFNPRWKCGQVENMESIEISEEYFKEKGIKLT